VALLLGTGAPRTRVEPLAAELLERAGGLRALAAAHPAELSRVRGIGAAKAARLLAAVEIGRRVGGSPWQRGEPFLGARQVFEHFAPRLRDERRELFIAAYLDVRRRLIGEEVISCGSLVASIVHPREVFRPAVRLAAASVIAVHNHPSGDPTPSAEDWAVTERLRRSGETLGIELLDHVVIGDGSFASLREECGAPGSK
jgi:DNA repair protein RadC